LELSFTNTEIRKICEDNTVAKETYGQEVAYKLKSRLADLIAADNVMDLPVGNIFMYNNGDAYKCKIDLSGGYKIIFCQNHVKVPLDDNGETNWSKVSRIKILQISRNE